VNTQLEQNNFLFVPNFISQEQAQALQKQFEELEQSGDYIKNDGQAPRSPAVYNFKPFLDLLCQKTLEVSTLIEEPVLPTYTYARIYKNGEILARHRDRPACEISLTVHIGGDAAWDIGIQKPSQEEVSLNLKTGDAMLYLGCIADHWRDKPFTGQNYGQVFLHYVRSNGPNAWAYFDKKQ
jgi:alkylated DNA repair dioxygenase AlkB